MKCMEKAYAKVNLTLQVGSRRPDGYHAVMSVMQRISLWDTVTVERGTGRGTLLCSVPVTENVDDNLCMKAARAFFAETGTKSDGVTITLEKHIPVQAGLGGGSSDAAAYAGNGAEGKLVVGGSSSVSPVMEKLIEAYKAVNANADIELQTTDSTTGMTSAIEGTYDIGMASRELKDDEAAALEHQAIAMDGIAVIVSDVLNMNKLESGAVTLELGGKNYRVRKGDSFSFKPSQQHDLKNTGKTPATVLWVCTPPNF